MISVGYKDLKSLGRKAVRVRPPPSAPLQLKSPMPCVMATEGHLRGMTKDFQVTLLTYRLNVFIFNGRLECRRLRC
jgi:hypothetical protein